MWIFLIIVIISLIGGLVIGYRNDADFVETILGGFLGTMVGMVLGMFVVMVISFSMEYVDKEYPHCYLYNLQDDSQVNGNFTLGSGRIQEKQYFVFYSKDSHGFKYSKLDASKCRIQEWDGKPILIRIEREPKNPNFFTKGLTLYPDVEWIFKVPKGTVIRQFNLDLQ